jgi:predicted RND superfamily exporter protein|tara:strand:+ start:17289 stop:19925 length:2637 start_codon:yes stop_codon:yes gene_type:complete
MWQQIANLILRNRFFILGVITLLTVFFGYYAITGVKLDNKYGNMLPKESATQTSYLKFKELFGEDGGTLVLAIENDSLYTEQNFLKWKELGDSILQYNGVESIISEATLFTISNNTVDNKFEAKRIFSDITYSEKSIVDIEKEIKNNPVYRNLLYSDTAKVSIMMIGIDEKYLSDTKRANVVIDIEKVAKSYEPYFGHIRYAGLPHLRVIIGKKVINEMYIFVGLSIFITSLLLWLFFRSLRVVMISNIVVFVAVIWSMGSIGLLGFNISVLMALIPPLMIVIGIPNCIFLMTKYHQEFRAHGNKVLAISRVIKKIGTATFLTNLTTAFGFSTFIFTNSEKLTEFGVVASLNILVVFLLSITILPIVISLSKEPKKRHLKHLDRKFAIGFIDRLVHIAQTKRKTIYVVTILIVTFSIIGLFRITATGNITSDLPQGNQILEDVHFMQDKFGGSIPFEIMIDYKKKGRLFSNETMHKMEEVQTKYSNDSLFAKTISIVDFIKVINMAYHGNDPNQYKLVSSRDKLRLKKYLDNFNMTNANGGGFTIKELVDTNETMLRIRTQMMDLGSYEVAQKVDSMRIKIDEIFNPDRKEIERIYKLAKKQKGDYFDSLIFEFPGIYNNLTNILSKGDSDVQYAFDMDPDKVKGYYSKAGFETNLRQAIDEDYYDIVLTGTAVVASEGTQYLVINLFTSLLFAILGIAILMAILFRSWRMVLVSLLPNLIPLVFTGGIMGWFGIPLKPSTLLVFSIAFGISVDDTIHFLAKYRQELKANPYDLKGCVLKAIHEAGLGMFYTSIVLFCGFSVFTLSEFGGTQALGLLVSLTLLVAMITNLVVLPSLLLSLERRLTTKSFVEPYFDVYDEETDMDFDDLQVETKKPLAE